MRAELEETKEALEKQRQVELQAMSEEHRAELLQLKEAQEQQRKVRVVCVCVWGGGGIVCVCVMGGGECVFVCVQVCV